MINYVSIGTGIIIHLIVGLIKKTLYKNEKLDIDKVVSFFVHLCKFSNVVKNDVVKKAAYDKLAAKVNNIDASVFFLKTKYETKKAKLEKKIPHLSNLVKKKTHWIRKKNSRY